MSERLDQFFGQTLNNFEIAPDIQALSRIANILNDIQSKRRTKIDEASDTLRALERNLELSKSSLEQLENAQASSDLSSKMLTLDREKFALARNVNEMESSIQNLEAQLQRLKDEAAMLQEQDLTDVHLSAGSDDVTYLKLKCYRALGIDLVKDKAGNFQKLVIQGDNDVNIVKIDKKYSGFFYANYVWDLISDAKDARHDLV